MYDLIINRLYPYILPHKLKVFGAIVLSLVLALLGGAQVKLVKPIFDKGLDPSSPVEEVYKLAAMLLAIGLINFPCRFFHFYWLRFVVDRATCTLREELFKKMQNLPTQFFSDSKQGTLISHLLNDTQVFASGFRAVIDLIREPLKATVYLTLAFWSDWQLTLVIFFIAPFLVLIFGISGKKVKKNQAKVQTSFGELTHNISDGLSAHKITKAFNLQSFVSQRFNKAQNSYFSNVMKTTFVEEMAHPFVEVVGVMAFSSVIVFAHYRISSGEVSIGDFISFVAALALFMDPIRKFSQANVKLSQAKAAADQIFSVLDYEEERSTGKNDSLELHNEIKINNLSFNYGDADVLKDFSITIKKGEKVALVGASGSGKSTLINLLLGLYPIDRGEILIDGVSLDEIQLLKLRELYSLVGQDVFLFHDTILSNLTIGKEFNEKEIQTSLDVSYAWEFIKDLPEGLNTIVGDRGARLSGGQKQRVTIARAFLQNSDVLLFDEATSALDNESEKIVQKALDEIAKDKTVIAVAHRLSTIQNYDKIYVMNSGRIIESGNHTELINLKGEYFKLYELSNHSNNK